MGKRILLLLLLGEITTFLSAQSKEIDSLRQIAGSKMPDTIKVQALGTLSYYFEGDSGVYYAKQAILLAEKIGFLRGKAEGLRILGIVYSRIPDMIKSVESFQQSAELFRQINDESGEMEAIEGMGILYYLQKDYREELRNHQVALVFARKNRMLGRQIQILANSSRAYMDLGKMDSSEKYILQALALSRSLKNDDGYLTFVYTIYTKILFTLGRKSEGTVYSHLVRDIDKSNGDSAGVGYMDNLLSEHFLSENKTDSALFFAREAFAISKLVPDSLEIIQQAAKNLSAIYEFRSDFKSALSYYKISIKAQNDEFSQEKMSKLASLSFEAKQREQDLLAAKKEYRNKMQLYASLFVLIVLLVIGVILYRNNRQKQKTNAVLQKTLTDLKNTQAQLIQSEKMASLGELTAGIAHEIQNPLNFVNNFSDVNRELLDETTGAIESGNLSEAKELLFSIRDNEEKIRHHGQRADSIVKGMLQHSRSGTGQLEETEINALVNEYLNLAWLGYRSKEKAFNIRRELFLDEHAGKLSLVPQDIGRVLLNIFNNAFYSVSEKASVNPENYEPAVEIRTKKSSAHIEISIRDNGMGILQPIIGKIFQPFFTTKPTGQGTGLGLSLSYDIIKSHGGTLKVESEPGQYSEFIIQIPG